MKSISAKVALYLILSAVLVVVVVAFPPNYVVWKSRLAKAGTNIAEVEANKGILSSQIISRVEINPIYLDGKLEEILNEIDETIVSYELFSYGFIVIYDSSGEFVASVDDRI